MNKINPTSVFSNKTSMKKKTTLIKLYLPIIVFILGWWFIAFREPPHLQPVFTTQQNKSPSSFSMNSKLSRFDRSALQQALAGNTNLMMQLIADWDIDAQLLSAAHIQNIQRLDQPLFVRSQEIGRILASLPDASKGATSHRFLPQTYAAASFLLALVPPEEIVALPTRLRKEIKIYPKNLTDQIPLDIDRYNAERLFLKNPELAFIAHYSDPATVQTLTNQGIALYTMKSPFTIDDITTELLNIGSIIHRPLETELLKLFMDATLMSLENRLLLHRNQKEIIPRILFVNYHQKFSVSTLKTLTGQLLNRIPEWNISLQYVKENGKEDDWMVPIDKEGLLNLDPDYLMVISESSPISEKYFFSDNALKQLKAVKNNRLYFLEEAIQHSPSQYIVLAYYDIIHTLLKP